jgi:hypothetical protein
MPRIKGSDELYSLINALSTEEKGYYKKFAKRYAESGSDLLNLFDIISAQKIFDDAELKKKFKNLPVLKVQLFEQIIDSLLIIDNSSLVASFRNIQRAYLLQNRGFKKRAESMFAKATEKFNDDGNFLAALITQAASTYLAISNTVTAEKPALFLNDWQSRKQRYNISLNMDFTLHQQRLIYAANEFYHQQRDFNSVLQHVDDTFINDPNFGLSIKAKRARLSALIFYHLMKGNKQDYVNTLRELDKLLDKEYAHKTDDQNQNLYLITMQNLVTGYIQIGDIQATGKALEKLKRFTPVSTLNTSIHEIWILYITSEYFWFKASFKDGIKEMDSLFKKYNYEKRKQYAPVSYEAAFRHYALLHFAQGNFAKALLAITDLKKLSEKTGNIRSLHDALLFNIFIHHYLENSKETTRLSIKYLNDYGKKSEVHHPAIFSLINQFSKTQKLNLLKNDTRLFARLSLNSIIKPLIQNTPLSQSITEGIDEMLHEAAQMKNLIK